MSTSPWNTGWLWLPHLRTDALCQQPCNRIKHHSLQWWIKWNAEWYWKFDAKGELCIRYWRKDTNCNISLKTFLGKWGWISESSQGYCCHSQIITEGEWEYFVVQYAANRNKTNVASIWRTLLLIYVRSFQGSKRRFQCLLNRVWAFLVAKTNLIPKKEKKKKTRKMFMDSVL